MNIRKFLKLTSLVLGFVLLAGMTSLYIYSSVNIGVNKEFLLRKTVKQYSDMIDVGLHTEAFYKFLTPEAQKRTVVRSVARYGDNNTKNKCAILPMEDKAECLVNNFINNITYTDTQINALENFLDYAKKRKDVWKAYKIQTIVFSNRKRADARFIYKENGNVHSAIETWYYQNGNWMRDF